MEPWPRASGLLLRRWPVLRAGFCWLCERWRQLSLCVCVASLLELLSTLGLGELLAERGCTLSPDPNPSQTHNWIFLQIHPLGFAALKRGTWLLPCPAQTEHWKRRQRLCQSFGRAEAFPRVFSASCCPVPCVSAPSWEDGTGGCKVKPQR